ncbi:MAG: hypothetical protein Q8867_08790 [Bacteroidota bacterium]|nr:hypothetical protein [Bacteroidota bacterium]
MKTNLKIFALILMLMTGLGMPLKKASAQYNPVNFQVFYDELSPYGDWVYDQNYGYVWIPYTDPGFMPYETNGYWVLTEFGWTWVSNYPWGWATFHYGRWNFDPLYGAVWVPGYEWGPAWVVWRHAQGFYGWAPMGPGIDINIAFGPNYDIPQDRWIFVRDRDFCRHDLHGYYLDRSRNVTIINNSTVINNTYIDNSRHSTYVSGPRRDDVQRAYRERIQQVSIRDNSKPGERVEKGRLDIYRPMIEKTNGKENRIAPRTVTSYDKSKAVQERKLNVQPNQRVQPSNERNQTPSNGKASRIYEQPGNNTTPAKEIKNTSEPRNSNVRQETRPGNVQPQKTQERTPKQVNEQRQRQSIQKNNAPSGKSKQVKSTNPPKRSKPEPKQNQNQDKKGW